MKSILASCNRTRIFWISSSYIANFFFPVVRFPTISPRGCSDSAVNRRCASASPVGCLGCQNFQVFIPLSHDIFPSRFSLRSSAPYFKPANSATVAVLCGIVYGIFCSENSCMHPTAFFRIIIHDFAILVNPGTLFPYRFYRMIQALLCINLSPHRHCDRSLPAESDISHLQYSSIYSRLFLTFFIFHIVKPRHPASLSPAFICLICIICKISL